MSFLRLIPRLQICPFTNALLFQMAHFAREVHFLRVLRDIEVSFFDLREYTLNFPYSIKDVNFVHSLIDCASVYIVIGFRAYKRASFILIKVIECKASYFPSKMQLRAVYI
jgi:hypothetical protein